MPDRLQDLRRYLSLNTVDPAVVRRRVDAALDAGSPARKHRRKYRFRCAAAVASAMVLTGAALAVEGQHPGVLGAFFEGGSGPAEQYINETVCTVDDGGYRFTVECSVSDGRGVYLIYREEALTEAAAADMASGYFNQVYHLHAVPYTAGGDATLSTGEYRQLPAYSTDAAHTYGIYLRYDDTIGPAAYVEMRRGVLEPVVVPVTPAAGITIPINASGPGMATAGLTKEGGVTVDSVTLTPFNCFIKTSYPADTLCCCPQLLFCTTDGIIHTQTEWMEDAFFWPDLADDGSVVQVTWEYRFRSAMDLEQMERVIVFGRAYPLDGRPSRPAGPASAGCQSFLLPVLEGGDGDDAQSYISLRDVTEKLGGTYICDPAADSVSCVTDGLTLTFSVGSNVVSAAGPNKTFWKEQLSCPPVWKGSQFAVSPCDLERLLGIEIICESCHDSSNWYGVCSSVFRVVP